MKNWIIDVSEGRKLGSNLKTLIVDFVHVSDYKMVCCVITSAHKNGKNNGMISGMNTDQGAYYKLGFHC